MEVASPPIVAKFWANGKTVSFLLNKAKANF